MLSSWVISCPVQNKKGKVFVLQPTNLDNFSNFAKKRTKVTLNKKTVFPTRAQWNAIIMKVVLKLPYSIVTNLNRFKWPVVNNTNLNEAFTKMILCNFNEIEGVSYKCSPSRPVLPASITKKCETLAMGIVEFEPTQIFLKLIQPFTLSKKISKNHKIL